MGDHITTPDVIIAHSKMFEEIDPRWAAAIEHLDEQARSFFALSFLATQPGVFLLPLARAAYFGRKRRARRERGRTKVA